MAKVFPGSLSACLFVCLSACLSVCLTKAANIVTVWFVFPTQADKTETYSINSGELEMSPIGGTVSSKTSVESGFCPWGDNYSLSWGSVRHTNLSA